MGRSNVNGSGTTFPSRKRVPDSVFVEDSRPVGQLRTQLGSEAISLGYAVLCYDWLSLRVIGLAGPRDTRLSKNSQRKVIKAFLTGDGFTCRISSNLEEAAPGRQLRPVSTHVAGGTALAGLTCERRARRRLSV